MGNPTPKSSSELIAAADTVPLTPVAEFWEHLLYIKFDERYCDALIQAGIPASIAADAAGVIRLHTQRITEGVRQAIDSMREIVAEAATMQRQARAGQPDDSQFKI